MGIDWEKCEIAPQRAQKVEGRILLDLRAKVNQLEHDLALSKEQLRKSKEEFRETQKKLTGREKSLVKITEKFSSAKKNLDNVAEQKLNVDIKLTKLKPEISELKKQLSEANARNIQLQQEFKFSNEKVSDGEIKATIVHELGHAFGLGHSDSELDIMYPFIDSDHSGKMIYDELSRGDKEAI